MNKGVYNCISLSVQFFRKLLVASYLQALINTRVPIKLLSCRRLRKELPLPTKRRVEHLVLLATLLLELTLLLGGRILVLLVLGDEVVHVGLGLGELHLVHAFASVPDIVSFDAGKRLRI